MGSCAVNFVRHCFSAEEWDGLNQSDEFRRRLDLITTIDEAEELLSFALFLLMACPATAVQSEPEHRLAA
jgi:hypothetical protein